MPPSNSLLDNRYFKQLAVNRLEAQAIRSNNISSQTPSYLFSAVFNGNFTRNSSGGTLTFTSSDVDSIIQFTDRPLRQTRRISLEEFFSLFSNFNSGSNTFAEDPPNAVLVHEEEQRTYVVRLLSFDSNIGRLTLELLPNESHKLADINGKMSLFVDDLWDDSGSDSDSDSDPNESYGTGTGTPWYNKNKDTDAVPDDDYNSGGDKPKCSLL